MSRVELKEGTRVFTSDEKEVGTINRFVLDPDTNEVTHIVVQKGWLFTEDKVVPLDWVASTTEEKVVLRENTGNFDELPPFEETYFIRADEQGVSRPLADDYPAGQRAPAYYWYPPQGYIGYPAYGLGAYSWPPMATERNIPGNTVPLMEGADIMSSDGEHVGDVERLLIDPETNKTTHFVISQGLFFKDRKLVPTNWVRSVEENKVHLTMSSKLLQDLPSYEA